MRLNKFVRETIGCFTLQFGNLHKIDIEDSLDEPIRLKCMGIVFYCGISVILWSFRIDVGRRRMNVSFPKVWLSQSRRLKVLIIVHDVTEIKRVGVPGIQMNQIKHKMSV